MQLIGEAAPQISRYERCKQSEQSAASNQQFDQTVDPQGMVKPTACSQTLGDSTTVNGAETEPHNKTDEHEQKDERGGTEAVSKNSEPYDLIAKTDEARQTVGVINALHGGGFVFP